MIRYEYKAMNVPATSLITGEFALTDVINAYCFSGEWEFVSFTTKPAFDNGSSIDEATHCILVRRLSEVPTGP